MSLTMNQADDATAQAETREQVLKAAASVFAETGFRAATVRGICQRAGANIAAVNYHFGDNETLYTEVLQHALRAARHKHPPDFGLPPDAPAAERLRAFVHSFLLRIFDEGPHTYHGKLMAREMIEPTQALDTVVREHIRPMADQLAGIVTELLGPATTKVLVRRCSMSVVSQVLFYQHCRPVIRRMFPDLKFDADQIAELAGHITRFSLEAMRGIAAKHIAAIRKDFKAKPTARHRPNRKS
ncbi:MAG: CerR family C-terminal domain-containing protein [Verrucomicrobia bacterium]|nr:CerR family C-terminal domain-containing protein [Verrucomicrobiota bacterium]